jgi:hypothetical protein
MASGTRMVQRQLLNYKGMAEVGGDICDRPVQMGTTGSTSCPVPAVRSCFSAARLWVRVHRPYRIALSSGKGMAPTPRDAESADFCVLKPFVIVCNTFGREFGL